MGFKEGKLTKTLFIKRYKGDILLVQVYVDDIIFSSTRWRICIGMCEVDALEKFPNEFLVGVLFFLEITKVKTASTPIETQKPLLKDEDGKKVDVHMYRSMISSLMYLTYSRPDIMFAITSWQFKKQDSGCNSIIEVADKQRCVRLMMGCRLDGIRVNCGYSNSGLLSWSKTINGEAQLHALVDGKKIIITESSVRRDLQLVDEEGVDCLPNSTIFEQLTLMRKPKRKDTQVPQPSDPIENIADEAIYMELGDSLVRAATTASSLEAKQDSSNINKTQSKVTLQSDEDRLKLNELMALCTTLQNRVLDLEMTKTTQHNEIASLKRRVKKLEKKNRSRTHRLKRLYKVGLTARVESSNNEESLGEDASKQGRIDAIDADEEITLDKGKGILIEPVKPMNKKDLIRLDEETALNLQAEFDEEERLAREKAEKEEEANISLIETWRCYTGKDLMLIINWLKNASIRTEELVNTFEDFRTDVGEGKEKRAGPELIQEITKKEKVEDDKETTELKQLMKIIPNEDKVAIDAIPLTVKSPNLYVGREEVSPCTTYTFNDVGKEAYD
ncbi:hypothetical protein Tco_0632396 [Tanacetum coccineum]